MCHIKAPLKAGIRSNYIHWASSLYKLGSIYRLVHQMSEKSVKIYGKDTVSLSVGTFSLLFPSLILTLLLDEVIEEKWYLEPWDLTLMSDYVMRCVMLDFAKRGQWSNFSIKESYYSVWLILIILKVSSWSRPLFTGFLAFLPLNLQFPSSKAIHHDVTLVQKSTSLFTPLRTPPPQTPQLLHHLRQEQMASVTSRTHWSGADANVGEIFVRRLRSHDCWQRGGSCPCVAGKDGCTVGRERGEEAAAAETHSSSHWNRCHTAVFFAVLYQTLWHFHQSCCTAVARGNAKEI